MQRQNERPNCEGPRRAVATFRHSVIGLYARSAPVCVMGARQEGVGWVLCITQVTDLTDFITDKPCTNLLLFCTKLGERACAAPNLVDSGRRLGEGCDNLKRHLLGSGSWRSSRQRNRSKLMQRVLRL
jgi:hypothetical protein